MKGFFPILFFLISFATLNGQRTNISTAHRIFVYEWIENPLEIIIENFSCDDIIVKANIGTIIGQSCEYIYTINDTTAEKAEISVGVKSRNKIKWIKQYELWIKPAPTPKVDLSISRGDYVEKKLLVTNPHIYIFSGGDWELTEMPNKAKILEHSIQIKRNDSLVFEGLNSDGNEFSKETKEFIKEKCKNNDYIILSNVTMLLYNSEKRKMQGIVKLKIISDD